VVSHQIAIKAVSLIFAVDLETGLFTLEVDCLRLHKKGLGRLLSVWILALDFWQHAVEVDVAGD
jgi:hypothetical protein